MKDNWSCLFDACWYDEALKWYLSPHMTVVTTIHFQLGVPNWTRKEFNYNIEIKDEKYRFFGRRITFKIIIRASFPFSTATTNYENRCIHQFANFFSTLNEDFHGRNSASFRNVFLGSSNKILNKFHTMALAFVFVHNLICSIYLSDGFGMAKKRRGANSVRRIS